jgi:hypothetical protein
MRILSIIAGAALLLSFAIACTKQDDIYTRQTSGSINTGDSLFAGLNVTEVNFFSPTSARITFIDKTTLLARRISDEVWAFKYGDEWRATIGIGNVLYDAKSTSLTSFADSDYVNKQTVFFTGADSVYTYNLLSPASKPLFHTVLQRNINRLKSIDYLNPNPVVVEAFTCCTAATQREAMRCAFALASQYCGTDDWEMDPAGSGGGPSGGDYNFSLSFGCRE